MKAEVITKLIIFVIPMIIMSQYPNIQNFNISSYSYDDGQLTVTGTFDIYYSDDARNPYKQDNFYWFNLWWQNQVNEEKIDIGPFKVTAIEWTQLEVHEDYEKLGFTAVLQGGE